ncbi:MAG: hypothetical protein ACI85U_003872 [Candidatus Promineifilaceae bacterium]|jgi:hypothetical protein
MQISQTLFEELYELEESLWRAEDRFSREKMEPIFATDFFEFGRSGRIYTREQTLSHEGGDIPIELPLINFQVRWLAENIVQTTYISRVHFGDGVEVEVGNRSSIWTHINGYWEIRFHQGTPVFNE